ncbi:MAG: prephenate dehydrogenase/arogenate dehydrogenase family protein [candidate division NC10 bacterium]|nr:prephenate dehydrogenase/arogenate dehydrogenase family protein [candidate division NC10 bacterium]
MSKSTGSRAGSPTPDRRPPTPLFRQMAVLGVGLIGGSLALAAKRAGAVGRVVGLSRSAANRAEALRAGIVDEATDDLAAAVSGADLVVLATPVYTIVAQLPQLAPLLTPACLVTDVGSVKGPILAAGDAAFPDGRFVAGHPIAGSEHSGPAAARADLFVEHNWIVTPGERTRPEAVARLSALWRAAGARVVSMAAPWHDQVFAAVSHLPHVVAYALMDAVLCLERDGERVKYAAGGLRDYTRIAGSDPEMWRDIFLMNREALLNVMAEYRRALDRLEAAIRAGDGEALTRQLLRLRRGREEIGHRS